jgi:prolyl-tRNA synthetase
MEAAESIVTNESEAETEFTLVHTPGMQTIDDVCAFLNLPVEKSCKTVVYEKESDGSYVVVFIRGDLEINEVKLKNVIGGDIRPGVITAESGLEAGYIGPHKLDGGGFTVLHDKSLQNACNLCCGANINEYHYTGVSYRRDVKSLQGETVFHDLAKAVTGGVCPACRKPELLISRGIELGNIFQLGTKYTQAMDMQYTGPDGGQHYPIMGCYGIGVGRLAAAVCESRNDGYGPLWPITIAPWQVHICCVRADDAVLKEYADGLYDSLQKDGVEVIYDDRPVSAGVMFSDADLIGVPLRLIASPRNMKENAVEIVSRDKSISKKVKTGEAFQTVKDLLNELQAWRKT